MQLLQTHRLRADYRGQGGFSLIESIIAVAIIGSTVMALITAIFTVLISTNSHKRIVFSGVELTTVAEAVRDVPYVACESDTALQGRLASTASAMLPGYALAVTEVTYLSDKNSSTPTFYTRPSCISVVVNGISRDNGVQRVVLKVSSIGAPNVSEDLVVMKRDERCPPALPVTPGRKC